MKTRVLLSFALILSVFSLNVKAIDPVKDSYSYPTRNDGKFTLTSKWLYSVSTGTYNTGTPPNFLLTTTGTALSAIRQAAYWNGKMIFGSRNDNIPAIIIVDAATGAVENSLTLVADGFAAVQNPCNYIVVDAGNNVLVGNVKLANTGVLQIWKVDMTTGVGTKLVEAGAGSLAAADRIDAFNVLGDVSGNATIWAVSSTSTDASMNMFRWKVTNGIVSADPDLITIKFSAGGFPSTVTAIGTSPCVFPISNDLVYIDGSNTYPTLMQITGDAEEGYEAVALDGFYDVLDATIPIPNYEDQITEPGKVFGMQPNHNGFAQFSIGNDHFFVMPVRAHGVITNYTETPQQSFRLFKYKDDAKRMREAEILWTFPDAGLSTQTATHMGNDYYLAPVAVNVVGKKAEIYIYSGGNGFGAYEFNTDGGTGIENPVANKLGAYASGKTIKFTESVASIQVYTVTGQLVAKKVNTASADVADSGIYVVKAITLNGETVVSKVIVK